MTDAYPLSWPAGWPRTKYPQRSNFGNHTIYRAAADVEAELIRLGAKRIIISANLIRNMDGGIRSKQAQPEDRGVAVYFNYNGGEQCIPCDRWQKVEDNLRAIVLTVSALRGLERWGAKEMVNAAFRGFLAIPEKAGGIDYFAGLNTREEVVATFRALAKEKHPDVGGDETEFSNLQEQYKIKIQTVKNSEGSE